jgi:hypothetical protein
MHTIRVCSPGFAPIGIRIGIRRCLLHDGIALLWTIVPERRRRSMCTPGTGRPFAHPMLRLFAPIKDQFMLTDTASEQADSGILSPHEGSPVSERVDHAGAMGGLAQFFAGWAV